MEVSHEHVHHFIDGPDADVPRLLVLVRDVLGDLVEGVPAQPGADGEGLDPAHAPPEEVLDLLFLSMSCLFLFLVLSERGRRRRKEAEEVSLF